MSRDNYPYADAIGLVERRNGIASRSLWDRTEPRQSIEGVALPKGGMRALVTAIPAMSPQAVSKVRAFENLVRQAPQTPIATHHLIHAGMYSRTITMPADTVLTSALIKRATILIVDGDATVAVGDDTLRLTGYHVLPASAHRKVAFLAHADTHLTMLFPTGATDVHAAEEEFTDEADLLFSRHGENFIRVTGE